LLSDLRPRTRAHPRRAHAARHGRARRSDAALAVVRVVAASLAVLLVSGVSVGAIALAQLSGNIESVDLVGDDEVTQPIAAPGLGKFEGGFNVLVVGSDVCDKEGGCVDRHSELNDVTMLIHIAADQSSAVGVSFPRDLVVPIPSCPQEDGEGFYSAMSARPINNTLAYGGLACTVLTVEALTGFDIPYAGLITFNGVIGMSNAVGGVPVCIDGPINDRYSGFSRDKAGEYTLQGQDALNFLRTRHGVGDGSDLGRISSQQVFLSSLVRTIKSDTTLNDPSKLLAIATAATSNMKLSQQLANLNTMVAMSLVLKDIPLDKITFVQYPGTVGQGGIYSGKVAPITAQADALFAKLASDEPFALAGDTGIGSTVNPDAPTTASVDPSEPVDPAPLDPAVPVDPDAAAAEPAAPTTEVLPGLTGQTAADYTCSRANK